MKNVLLLLCVLFFSSQVFPQWTNESSLFSVNSGTKVESCVSIDGSHVFYSNSGLLKYAFVNSSGTLIRNIQIESSGADFPNIVSSGSNLYAVYTKNKSDKCKN